MCNISIFSCLCSVRFQSKTPLFNRANLGEQSKAIKIRLKAILATQKVSSAKFCNVVLDQLKPKPTQLGFSKSKTPLTQFRGQQEVRLTRRQQHGACGLANNPVSHHKLGIFSVHLLQKYVSLDDMVLMLRLRRDWKVRSESVGCEVYVVSV